MRLTSEYLCLIHIRHSFANYAGLFITMLLLLFGIVGEKGTVIYHYLNPLNLFNLDLETVSIMLIIILTLIGSFVVYRPFFQLICPFGFVSWLVERFSVFQIQIDEETCTKYGACIKTCLFNTAKDRIIRKKMLQNCFSCGRCLNVCPVDVIRYKAVSKKTDKIFHHEFIKSYSCSLSL